MADRHGCIVPAAGSGFFVAADDARFEKGRAAQVWIEGKLAGMFGELAHDLSKGWRTTHKIYVAQLDVDPILAADHGYSYYVPFSLYPATTRDVAFIAPEKLDNAEVLEFIRKCELPNVESARLFDLFVDDKLKAEHKKSVAYQVTFRNAERTLTDNEVNSSFEKLRTRLANELKVELR
jgi:phenylalanyl-tRNA synthetase beta chain